MSDSTDQQNSAPLQRKSGILTDDLPESLRPPIRDGMAAAVMVGAGETYIGAYGIFLQATTFQVGYLGSIPQFLGAIFQYLGVFAMERLHSRRRIISSTAAIQALLWIPIALIGFALGKGEHSVNVLIICSTLYFVTAGFITPIWSSLIGDLVPAESRGRFFGHRNALIGIVTFGSLFLGGVIIDVFSRLDHPTLGFAAIFLAASYCRYVSSKWLAKYEDPPFTILPSQRFSFFEFIRRTRHSNFARFVLFASAMAFSQMIAGPFFSLYMLDTLHFSYWQYTLISAASTVMQFLAMQYWGGLSDSFGNKKILTVCGYGIGIVPILWLFSNNMWWLLLVQTYAGFTWAGFNLATANFMFDAVSPPKRARCAAYQGIMQGFGILAGSFLGGYLGTHLPSEISLFGWSHTLATPLIWVFLFSGLARLLTARVFFRMFDEVRVVKPIRHRDLVFSIAHIRPLAGVSFSLLTDTKRKKKN